MTSTVDLVVNVVDVNEPPMLVPGIGDAAPGTLLDFGDVIAESVAHFETVTVEEQLAPGAKGRMSLRGTDWTVINCSDQTFEKGQRVQISSVEGLTLNLDVIVKN